MVTTMPSQRNHLGALSRSLGSRSLIASSFQAIGPRMTNVGFARCDHPAIPFIEPLRSCPAKVQPRSVSRAPQQLNLTSSPTAKMLNVTWRSHQQMFEADSSE